MPKITELSVQKKNKKRISVFVDGEYAFSIFDELAAVYHLEVGKDINTVELKELFFEDEYKRAFSRAVKALSYGEKSKNQINELLEKAEFDEKVITRVLDRLVELDYVCDERLAQEFVAKNTSLGSRAIKVKLKQKGIDDEIIANALLDNDETGTACELAKKLMQKHASLDELKRKRKISEHLARRGFCWDTISYAISCAEEDQ